MDVTEARRNAARLNARPAPFPKTPDGRQESRAEALRSALSSQTVVPEDAAAIFGRGQDWFYSLKPQNLFDTWIMDQISVVTLRIDRSQRIDRRGRDRSCLRAELCWDLDRRHEAEILGEGLEDEPADVVHRLRQTPHGCDWLVERLAMLARVADRDGEWTPDQKALASRMLGTPAEFRHEDPLASIDLEGRELAPSAGLAALARREIAHLKAVREQVVPLDEIDRALAMSDHLDDDSPQARRQQRHENALFRHLRWLIAQLQNDSPRKYPSPILEDYFDLNPRNKPQPEPEPAPPPNPEPVASAEEETPDPEPEIETEVDPENPTLPIRRRDTRALKAESRRQSRVHKLERRRS